MTALPLPHTPHRIVFADVDGTILDDAQRLPATWPSIRHAMRDAMVVLTSSRTVEELLEIQRATGIEGPFIAENGAMLVLTNEWIEHAQGTVISVGRRMLRLVPIGTPGSRLAAIVKGAADASGVVIETQRDVTTADLPHTTPTHAPTITSYALARAHSLLLRISGSAEHRLRFFASLAAAGLTISHGGRWHVVQGGSNKGIAVRALVGVIRRLRRDALCLIGVGNAQNDRSMLEAVDLRFVMRRPDGEVDPALVHLEDACIADTPGVDGWNDFVHRMYPATSGGRAHA